jgi:hypothetical protein
MLQDSTSQKQQPSLSINDLEEAVTDYYGPEIWKAVKAGLGVICSLALTGRVQPLSLIYEGPSGRGKSTCINLFEPNREATKKLFYRLDTFTPKAFVSHAANVSKEDIGTIDLLPKLNNKVLLVKELAPQFRGTDADLRERFAILTAVLDGKGHLSASGVHGTRGYEGEYVFNWLGATTPIPTKTDQVMAQLGNRLLRYEFLGEQPTEEELLAFLEGSSHAEQERQLRTLMNQFLENFFRDTPVSSVNAENITMEQELKLELIRLASLLSQARVEIITHESNDSSELELEAGAAEGPFRIVLLLKQLAQGLALAFGRREVQRSDMQTLRHIAISSIPVNRRRVLKALIANGNSVDSGGLEKALRLSRPTVRKYMQELAATGIVNFQKGTGQQPDSISFADVWKWLEVPMVNRAEGEGANEDSSDSEPVAAA